MTITDPITGPCRPVPYTLTAKAHAALDPGTRGFPTVVCLCGSARFTDAYRYANLRLTLAGQIVLTTDCDTEAGGYLASESPAPDAAGVKAALDELHRRKIDLADYVFVLNVGGYIGESTRSQIIYANDTGKPVRYFWPGTDPYWHGNDCTCPHCAPWDQWSCTECGDGYFGTPPDDGLCPWCRPDSPAATERR